MEKKQELIFGVNPVLEALKASAENISEILLSEGSARPALGRILQEAQEHDVKVVSVHPRVLDQAINGRNHQGVAARIKPYGYVPFAAMLESIAAFDAAQRILILDGLTDPRNFGALLRTADAAGIRYVVIPKDRSVDVTPVVLKASAGAAQHVKVVKVTNLRRAILDLKEHGYWVVGLDPKSRETIFDRSFPAKLAVVLGSEGTGVRPINLRECDLSVSIPMLGKVASLNVSVAGAVFLYELVRQQLGTEIEKK
jgi:23S rRNA (guanosine2251-2'-O)-methyltransferase